MAEPLHVVGASTGSLLGYLKGLGLLHIVARQADRDARACWRDGALELHTRIDARELERFLLDEWVPAPVVSPWSGGSGFFPGDNQVARQAIEASHSPRLAQFRSAIATGRDALARAGLSAVPEPKLAKPALLRDLRATLSDAALEWLDAAVVLVGDAVAFPPLLGSGGNEGRFDYSNNYAQSVVFALGIGSDGGDTEGALGGALWRAPTPLRPKLSLGQLAQDGSAVNSPSGSADGLGNPWDLALAMHGTLVAVAGAGRRLAHGVPSRLAAPFTLEATGAGYGSAVAGEKGRAELWMPLWRSPATLSEVETLFREARAQVGRRRARTGLDAARAAGELGVARGIDAFERYALLERAGQANLAVPVGRVEVRARPGARVLGTLDPWLGRLLNRSRGDLPGAQRDAVVRLERAAFAVADRGTPETVAELLVAVGTMEGLMAVADERHRPAGLMPVSPLAEPWLESLGLMDLEMRLAIALGSVAEPWRPDVKPLAALRDYLHGTGFDERGRRRYGVPVAGRVPAHAGVIERLGAAHERRHHDAARVSREDIGFVHGREVAFADLARLTAGDADERRLGRLLDGAALLDHRHSQSRAPSLPASTADPLLGLLGLSFHDPGGVDPARRSRPRLDWVARLRAGRISEVAREALLRLRLAELDPLLRLSDLQLTAADGPRFAAALLARPSRSDLRRVTETMTIDRREVPT